MLKIILRFLLTIIVALGISASILHAHADDEKTGSMTAEVFVRPRFDDLNLSTVLNPDGPLYARNERFEVKTTYGSNLDFTSPIEIVCKWSRGTIEGQSYPTVDVLNYEASSASNAYNNTPPVIDLVNRTITWTVSSFPAQLNDQEVSFRLIPTSEYITSKKIYFTIDTYLTASGTTIDTPSITKSYLYHRPYTGPTSTPGPQPQPTATPTPTPFTMTYIEIREISDNSIKIYLNTNELSKTDIDYGTSIASLDKTVSDNSFGYEHELTLPELSPNKKYYFKVTITNQKGRYFISNVYTAKTALASESPTIAKNTLAIASSNILLVAPVSAAVEQSRSQENKTLVIPSSTIYDLRFSLNQMNPVNSIKVALRPKKNVLGISDSIFNGLSTLSYQTLALQDNYFGKTSDDYSKDIGTRETYLTQIQPGAYSGRLISDLPKGNYELFAIIFDQNGNISETKLSDVKIIDKLTVLSANSKEPIEAVRVYLSFYDSSTNKYEPLLPTLISIVNPSFTDTKGESPIVLPQGRYSALVSDLGYKDKTVNFIIGINENENFPIVYLEKEASFNIFSTIIYYGRVIRDVYVYNTFQYFTTLSKSLRFFNLINALSLAFFVVVTFFSFIFRTRIPAKSILRYLTFHLKKLVKQNISQSYLEGIVSNKDTSKPIKGVNIYLINKKSHQIIMQTSTDVNGHFFFKLSNLGEYEILTAAKGYEATSFSQDMPEVESGFVRIQLKKAEMNISIFGSFLKFLENLVGYSFELLLILSFVFEALSIPYFGLQRTLPFLIISVFNLLLWLLHLKQKKQSAKLI